MEYGNAASLLNNLAAGLPSFYTLMVMVFALVGLFWGGQAVFEITSANRNNQTTPMMSIGQLIIGSVLFSLGSWIGAGSAQIFNTTARYEIMEIYTPLAAADNTAAILYPLVSYIVFVGWLLSGLALVFWRRGIRDAQKNPYALKVFGTYLLGIFAVNFPLFVDGIALQMGYGAMGTQYFTF